MRKEFKKVLSGAVICAMLSSSMSAFAASSVSVTKVEVMEGSETKQTITDMSQAISLTPAQMLKVTVSVTGATADSVFATFLSTKSDAATLSNDNVQYVGQTTVNDSTATFTFRPRTTLGTGDFTAKVGATEATTAATFNYSVAEAIKTMSMTAVKNSLPANSTDDATFKITGFEGTAYTSFKVYLDGSETELANDKYSIAMSGSDLVLTLNNSNFTGKTNGTNVSVKLTHDGYTDATGTVSITAAVYKVTWTLNGGASTGTMPETYTDGETLTLPTADTMSKDYHDFAGWYTDAEFTEGKNVASISTASADLNFYAKWTGKTYNITYELNGGTIADVDKKPNYQYGVGLTALPQPTKTNYDFDGWYADENCESTKVEKISNTEHDPKTLYAKWKGKKYTVTLNKDGGTVASGSEDVTEYTYGTSVTLPKLEKTGYKFDGWYAESNFSGEEVKTISQTDSEDKVYYAKWTAENYTITYDVDGGTIKDTEYAQNYTYGVGATLPTNVEKTGHKFDGWFDATDLEGSAVTSIGTDATGNKSYKAKWTANSYSVTLNLEGGSFKNESDNVTSYTYGVGASLPTPERDGFTFAGWYTAATDGEVVSTISAADTGDKILYAHWTEDEPTEWEIKFVNWNGEELQKGNVSVGEMPVYNGSEPTKEPATDDGYTYTFSGWEPEIVEVTAAATYTAKFTKSPKSYKITYKLDGGTLDSGDTDSYKHETAKTLPEPTKTGHKFEGWYTDNTFATKVTEVSADAIGDKIFYAKWSKESYKVNLVLNNGSLQDGEDITSYTYGDTKTLPTPTRTDYDFQGWYTEDNTTSTKVEEISSTDTEDKTFYAQWKKKQFTITFVNDDNTPLWSNKVDVGTTPSYSGTPTKKPATDDGYTYAFEKWEPAITTVSQDATYKATYTQTPKEYTVTLNANGGTLETIEVKYTFGKGVTLPTPSKNGYSFAGWCLKSDCSDTPIIAISTTTLGDNTYYAKWNKEEATEYAITFKNYDGTVLKTIDIAEGTMAAYVGDTPTKPQDDKYTYTHSGWTPELAKVTGAAEYTATFTPEPREYKVTLKKDGGSIASGSSDVTSYKYGTAVTLPTLEKSGFTFDGWYEDEALTTKVTQVPADATGDKIYYAKWTTKSEGGSTTPTTPEKVDVVTGALQTKVEVTKAVSGSSTTITVVPKTGEALPTKMKMYKVVYNADGTLKSIDEVEVTVSGDNATFTYDKGTLGTGESGNVMLFANNLTPIISAIAID